eukprot:6186691-Pleurochrysis_carterae.AAC.1
MIALALARTCSITLSPTLTQPHSHSHSHATTLTPSCSHFLISRLPRSLHIRCSRSVAVRSPMISYRPPLDLRLRASYRSHNVKSRITAPKSRILTALNPARVDAEPHKGSGAPVEELEQGLGRASSAGMTKCEFMQSGGTSALYRNSELPVPK